MDQIGDEIDRPSSSKRRTGHATAPHDQLLIDHLWWKEKRNNLQSSRTVRCTSAKEISDRFCDTRQEDEENAMSKRCKTTHDIPLAENGKERANVASGGGSPSLRSPQNYKTEERSCAGSKRKIPPSDADAFIEKLEFDEEIKTFARRSSNQENKAIDLMDEPRQQNARTA